MKALSRRLADAIVIGLLVVLLAPAVVHAVRELAAPVLVAVAVLIALRLVWFYTSL